MAFDLLTPQQMIAVQQDERFKVSTSTWRNMFYRPAPFMSPQGDIVISEVLQHRTIAPFVLPTQAGKPIHRNDGEELRMFRPAYIKVKDALRPQDAMEKTPGEISRRVPLMDPQRRFNKQQGELLVEHKQAISNTVDYLAAKALIDGQVRIVYRDDFGNIVKDVTVSYDRDPSHTVVLTGAARWTEAGVDPIEDIETWANRVALAKNGGKVRDIVMGAAAAQTFRKNPQVKDYLDNNFRGTEDIYVNRGIVVADPLNPFTLIATLPNGMNVWQFTDVVPVDDALSDLLAPNEILMVAPSNDNVIAYGAIYDVKAGLLPLDMFGKGWEQEDPSQLFLMTQSAPLPIIGTPNKTLKATVQAAA